MCGFGGVGEGNQEEKGMSSLSQSLRALVADIRRKPTPIGDLVPAVQAAADRAERMEDALDALILAFAYNHDGNGKIDWDDVTEAFEQARKCRPGKYETLVRELGLGR